MDVIRDEIAANAGDYPHNGGKLSCAEVARRAGIHATTLFTQQQRLFGAEVKAWIETVKFRSVVRQPSARRSLVERVASWKTMYEGLAQAHRDTELELQKVEADLAKKSDQLESVKRENLQLREMLTAAGSHNLIEIITRR